MNFVAIDFETAHEKRSSPCALGVTVVKNNQIVEERYWLIRPKELRFAPINIMIHGIRENDVIHELEFDELWPEILPYLENQLVVAHNASFDISVLRSTLDLYNLSYPSFNYCCTMVMSKHFYSYLENAKLNTVSTHLGHSFTHHHAGSDAAACANILLKISEELDTPSIEALTTQVGVKIGKVYEKGYSPAGSNGGGLVSSRKYSTPSSIAPPNYTDCEFFQGKYIAFTGPLHSMSRSKAIHIVEDLGGEYTPSVTRKTNLVITNVQNPSALSPEHMSTKLRRAMQLIERGQDIAFLTEAEFLEILGS